MTTNRKISAKAYYSIQFLKPILTILLIAFTAIFIAAYCHVFDEFGIIAKKRLLNYPLFTFLVTPLFFWTSAYLCRRYSRQASGHTFQAAIHKLERNSKNFNQVANFLNIRMVIVKAVSSLLATLGGGSLGKESPSVHMSAGIFASFAYSYKKFLPKISLEAWVFAGAATGLMVAFNAPIAATVYVVEKLLKTKFKDFQKNISWTLVIISITSIILYKPKALFNLHKISFAVRDESALLIVTAITCAFLAFSLKATNGYFYPKFLKMRSRKWHLVPIIAGLLVASINLYSGVYSFSGGIYTVEEALASSTPILSYKEVGGRMLTSIMTFSVGCAGGLVAPAIAMGAGVGSILSTLVPSADIGVFLLIGMVSFLSVVLGEPITAAIIIAEITGQGMHNIPFLLGASFIAVSVAKMIKKWQTEDEI